MLVAQTDARVPKTDTNDQERALNRCQHAPYPLAGRKVNFKINISLFN